ncbi:MAG: tetratricopeptide repeat protein [Verrucomicrobiota bacterium]
MAKDAVEAVRWYRRAAEQNDATAQYVLGGCYYNGRGILIDYVEAYKWNALAAAQGNEDAVNRWHYVFRRKTHRRTNCRGPTPCGGFQTGQCSTSKFVGSGQ